MFGTHFVLGPGAGYELTAQVEYIKYSISETMSVEMTDTRLRVLVGAGLPDHVLDAWLPDEGYQPPDEEALQSGSATPAELGRAKAARRTALLARLGAMADQMPTVFSLRGTAAFSASGNANETGAPTAGSVLRTHPLAQFLCSSSSFARRLQV